MEVCGLWPSHPTTKIPLVTIASAAVFEEKKHGIPQVLQPRYSPDPELCDIFLLKKDSHLKGKKISRRRRNRSECNEATDRYQKKESQDCFPQRKRHLDKVCLFSSELRQPRLKAQLIFVVAYFLLHRSRYILITPRKHTNLRTQNTDLNVLFIPEDRVSF